MPALSYVTVASGGSSAGATTLATNSWNLAAGNHVFVYARWEGGDTTLSVTDTAGNTYTPFTRLWGAAQIGGQWFYCLNATGHAANVVTVTWASARGFRYIRAVTLTGDAPASVTQKTAAVGNGTTLTIADDGVAVGASSVVLLGLSTYSGDSSRVFSGSGLTWNNVGSGDTYLQVGYGIASSGLGRPNYSYTGNNNTAKVLLALAVDGGGAVPATTTDAAKLNSYAVIGAALDGATTAKVNSYAVIGAALNGATAAKVYAYAVIEYNRQRVVQMATEVVRTNLAPTARLAQIAAEVLRPNVAVASIVAGRPVVMVCT